jgi:hypothetical protein
MGTAEWRAEGHCRVASRRALHSGEQKGTAEWRAEGHCSAANVYYYIIIIHLTREITLYTGFWWGNLRERKHVGDPGIDGRIILRWIIKKWDVRVWTGSSWLRRGTCGGHL